VKASGSIEEVFSSSARIRIVKVLLVVGPSTRSQIARRLKIGYGVASKHVTVLESCGVVVSRSYGKRVRVFRFNEGVDRGKWLRELIEEW